MSMRRSNGFSAFLPLHPVEIGSGKPEARFENVVRFDDLQVRIKRMDKLIQQTQGSFYRS